jgi:hypothetical protein
MELNWLVSPVTIYFDYRGLKTFNVVVVAMKYIDASPELAASKRPRGVSRAHVRPSGDADWSC